MTMGGGGGGGSARIVTSNSSNTWGSYAAAGGGAGGNPRPLEMAQLFGLIQDALGRAVPIYSNPKALEAFIEAWERRRPDYGNDAGMVPVVVAKGDYATDGLVCPHCRKGFEAGDVVMESVDQAVHIHTGCVEAIFRRMPGAETVDEAYERRLQQLLSERSPFDE